MSNFFLDSERAYRDSKSSQKLSGAAIVASCFTTACTGILAIPGAVLSVGAFVFANCGIKKAEQAHDDVSDWINDRVVESNSEAILRKSRSLRIVSTGLSLVSGFASATGFYLDKQLDNKTLVSKEDNKPVQEEALGAEGLDEVRCSRCHVDRTEDGDIIFSGPAVE